MVLISKKFYKLQEERERSGSIWWWVNRYKFTLFYTVLGFYLGGLIFAVPAIILSLILDYSITRPRDLNKDNKYPSASWVFLFTLFFNVFVYRTTLMVLIGPDTHDGYLYDWLKISEPFTNQVALYVPVFDKVSEQIIMRGDNWFVPVYRNLQAVFWFSMVIVIPSAYIDFFRWVKDYKENNYYASKHAFEIVNKPKKLESNKKPFPLLSDNPVHFYFGLGFTVFIFIPFLIAAGMFGFEAGYLGIVEIHDHTYYRGIHILLPIILVFWPLILISTVIFTVLTYIRFVKRRKFLKQSHTTSVTKGDKS